ncbi:hypothetical protein K502DRAFT_363591 [Neoconidiobolus thromboides FSU 785]|nr:hypothetical protein K502DRAFT_363591 [Neoconidiobolus thromboides FSU 785]
MLTQLIKHGVSLAIPLSKRVFNNSLSLLQTTLANRPTLLKKSIELPSIRGYKVRSSLKKRCEHCYFVRRRKRLFVICKENPKHKQRQEVIFLLLDSLYFQFF